MPLRVWRAYQLGHRILGLVSSAVVFISRVREIRITIVTQSGVSMRPDIFEDLSWRAWNLLAYTDRIQENKAIKFARRPGSSARPLGAPSEFSTLLSTK